MNFCSGCGKPIVLGSQFCSGCGAPVVAAETAMMLVGTTGVPVVYPPTPPESARMAPPPPPAAATLVAPIGVTGVGLKGPSRKVLILAGLAALLVALVVTGGLIARNLMRGGADSPEQAASKMIESVSNKDLVGAFLMVTPRERDAVVRVQESLLKKYGDFKIADAVGAAAGKAGAAAGKDAVGSELSFEGIDVSITGVQPRVTSISEDLAAVDLNSGELRITVDPAKTKGIVRAGLDASGTTKKYEQSFFLADIHPGSRQTGLTLIAKKTDGRWYISPLLSGLEIAHDNGDLNVGGNDQGNDRRARGTVPADVAKGADSATAAASAAVSALPLVARDGVKAIASYLEGDEADALYLYGEGIVGLTGRLSDFTVGSATFTPGPKDNDRAVAFVDRISFRAGSASNQTTITATCLNEEGGSENICLNGSGYYGYSGGQLVWGADRGKFAVTTVREDGGWKVSLLDTAADHAVNWLNSITREQALAYLGLERGDKTTGTLTVGKQSTVAFNSAGYAVMKLVVPRTLEINFAADGLKSMSIFDENGRTVDSLVKAGSYTVVIEADNKWDEAFQKQGNKVAFSAPILIQQFVEESTPTDSATAPEAGGSTPVALDQAKVAALMETVSANPTDIASLQGIGDLYFAATDYKNASLWERKVLEVDPENQVALLALGAAQFNLGNADEAKNQWLIAAGLYPNLAEVHYDLGFLYMSQTPPDTANMIREWKMVVAIDPSSDLAKTVAPQLKDK